MKWLNVMLAKFATRHSRLKEEVAAIEAQVKIMRGKEVVSEERFRAAIEQSYKPTPLAKSMSWQRDG